MQVMGKSNYLTLLHHGSSSCAEVSTYPQVSVRLMEQCELLLIVISALSYASRKTIRRVSALQSYGIRHQTGLRSLR